MLILCICERGENINKIVKLKTKQNKLKSKMWNLLEFGQRVCWFSFQKQNNLHFVVKNTKCPFIGSRNQIETKGLCCFFLKKTMKVKNIRTNASFS